LTKEIMDKYPNLTEEDFLAFDPLFICHKKEQSNDDLSNIEYHHPETDYEKQLKNKIILSDLLEPNWGNYNYNVIYGKKFMKQLYFKDEQIFLEIMPFDEKINKGELASIGINFRVHEHKQKVNMWKFTIEMKAVNEQTKGKQPKFYNGNKWLISKDNLDNEFKLFTFETEIDFNSKSKFRIGLRTFDFGDVIILRNPSLEILC